MFFNSFFRYFLYLTGTKFILAPDTKKLGKNCAQSAAKRARQKAKNGEFEPKAENYDGSIPIEEMPEMSLEEKVAYQEARIRYLEDYVEFQKKMPSILEEIYSSYSDKK